MADQVTKLAELLKKADENSALKGITDYEDALIDNAEYLIANGVIVLDMKVLSPKNIPLVTHFANMPFDEVFQLVKAKQQGKIIELPCKLGDTVYIIGGKRRCGKMEMWINTGKFRLTDIDKIGITVFLTLEAAEKAIQKRCDTDEPNNSIEL